RRAGTRTSNPFPYTTLFRSEPDCGEERDERHADGQEEHPAPADLGQEAAEDEPEREAGRAGRRVDGERLVPRGPLREARRDDRRSEEHTSELQSLAYLVCRL